MSPTFPCYRLMSCRPCHADPAPWQVWCDFREDYAITMLNILNKNFMELATGDQYMDYGANDVTLQALLNASYFCSQETKYGPHS